MPKLRAFQIDTVELGQDSDLQASIDHSSLVGVFGTTNTHADIDGHILGNTLKHDSVDITYDNTLGFFSGVDAQAALDEAGSAISVREASSSGTQVGVGGTDGQMTTNTTTTIDVAGGNGFVLDTWTDPDHPTLTTYTWSTVNAMVINMPDVIGVQAIYVDSSGIVLQQPGKMNNSEKRSNTVLGLIYYSNGVINAIENTPRVINNANYTFFDYIDFLSFNDTTNGLLAQPVDAALSIWVTGGNLFQVGIEWFVDAKNPNTLTFSDDGDVNTPIIFDVLFSDGSVYLSNQTVIPKFYEDVGSGSPIIAIALPDNDATIHYFFQLRGGKYVIQLGDTKYNDALQARGALTTDFVNYNVFPDSDVTFLSAQIYIGGNANDFTDEDLAGIVNIATAASASGGDQGGGTGVDEFLDLIDVIPTSYAGEAAKLVGVNPAESGLEFVTPAASAISYDDNNTSIGTGSPSTVMTVQDAVEGLDNKRRFKNTSHTGVRAGGLILEVTPTTFSVTDGDGAILDAATVPTAAQGTSVTWTGQTAIVLSQAVSGYGGTYIFIDNNGLVLQFITKPINSVFVQNIFLGVILYEVGVITNVFNEPSVLDSTAINFSDYIKFQNVNNHHGIAPLAIGSGDPASTLEFYVTAGEIFAEGANWHNDVYNPNVLPIPAEGIDSTGAGATFTYILGDGTIYQTGVTVFDEDLYDDGSSTPGAIPGTDKGLIQFIVRMPGGEVYVQFYTKTYRDGKAAASGVTSALADLILADAISEGTIIGAYAGQNDDNSWERGDRNSIIVLGNATGNSTSTDSSTTDDSVFIDLTINGGVVTKTAYPLTWNTTSPGQGQLTITHVRGTVEVGLALLVVNNVIDTRVMITAININTITLLISDDTGPVDGRITGRLLF